MHAPQRRHGVEGAMDPVLREVGRGATMRGDLRPTNGSPATIRRSRLGLPHRRQRRCRQQREKRQRLHRQMADQEVRAVGRPAEAERRLLAAQRERAFERYEDHGGEQHVQHEPVHADGQPEVRSVAERHVAAAGQRGHTGQGEPGQAEHLAAPQHQRGGAEQEPDADHRFEQRPAARAPDSARGPPPWSAAPGTKRRARRARQGRRRRRWRCRPSSRSRRCRGRRRRTRGGAALRAWRGWRTSIGVLDLRFLSPRALSSAG